MQLYSIKKDKHYFQGNKIQLAIVQYAVVLPLILLSIIIGNWWILFFSLFVFTGFSGIMKSETIYEPVNVYFFKNCTYKLTDNYDQVNKLYGFSEGFHHWNSARIGWRCVDGENIELLAYCYVNLKRIEVPLITCKPESWIFCNIQNQKTKYLFKVVNSNNESIVVSVDKEKKFSIYSLFKIFIYKLYPYFGGKISAPHDMSLYIKKMDI